MKNSILILLCALSLIAVGCGKTTLQPGGAYAPTNSVGVVSADMPFCIVDGAFDLAYAILDAAFKIERDNRAQLWATTPSIKLTLDEIRPRAAQAVFYYTQARKAYKAMPTPAGLKWCQEAMADMQKISTEAQATVPKGK
jgi:hypothetical protein